MGWKIFSIFLLGILLFLVLNIDTPAEALSLSKDGEVDIINTPTLTEDIHVERDKQNNLSYLQYDIASTYAQTGIRYRTVAITVDIPGMDQIVIPIKELMQGFNKALKDELKENFKYGKTYYSTMCIYRDAIINNFSNPAKAAELLDKVVY